MNREEATRRIKQAQAGDLGAFNGIVRQFQDMAVGYASSILGDFQAAQDAAQDAFVEAYLSLSALHSPEAFPIWLRKIVFKHCNRQSRKHRVATVPIKTAESLASSALGLEDVVQQQESQEVVRRAILSLPPAQREVITLFYLAQYSQQDIAEFLGLSVTTVKSRLHQGRSHLRESMAPMINENFQASYPPRDEAFAARVNKDIALALAAMTAETKDTPPAHYDLLHPVSQLMSGLMGSVLLWAIEVEAAEIYLVPKDKEVVVQFRIGQALETVMTLPKSLQKALTSRFKAAADMEIAGLEEPQEGLIPILYHEVEYEAVVTTIPSNQGERVKISLTPLLK